MFPEVALPIAQLADGEPCTIPGFRRYDARSREWGNFPAVQQDKTSSVDGLLFRHVNEKQLAQLDWFEDVDDGLYVREQILIQMNGSALKVEIYVCGPMLQRTILEPLTEAWDPDQFRDCQLDRYVKDIVLPAVRSPYFIENFGN